MGTPVTQRAKSGGIGHRQSMASVRLNPRSSAETRCLWVNPTVRFNRNSGARPSPHYFRPNAAG
jgi:hypothetical protein